MRMGKVVQLRPGDDERHRQKHDTEKKAGKVLPLPSAEPEREPLLGPVSSLMDEAFADAMARGLLDDLPGKGQPLPPSFFRDDPYQAENAWERQLLAESGLLPEWLKLRKQISVDLDWVRANRPVGAQAPAARSGDPARPEPTWEERVLRLNDAIHRFNRICPPMMQIPLYRPEFDA
jgi:hypothetical protein